VVKKHIAVAVGVNDYANDNESIHAEESALYDGLFDKRYHGAVLYVFRYKLDNEGCWTVENSRPCADCVDLIRRVGIKKVYYSVKNEEGDRGVEVIKVRDLYSTYISIGRRLQRIRDSTIVPIVK
jgi:deoxycytidylate deaminase